MQFGLTKEKRSAPGRFGVLTRLTSPLHYPNREGTATFGRLVTLDASMNDEPENEISRQFSLLLGTYPCVRDDPKVDHRLVPAQFHDPGDK